MKKLASKELMEILKNHKKAIKTRGYPIYTLYLKKNLKLRYRDVALIFLVPAYYFVYDTVITLLLTTKNRTAVFYEQCRTIFKFVRKRKD